MAVHVIPYNPWREQLAITALGNVAGNILGDLWQTHKQNEQNRKANAFRGALSDTLRNMAQQADITLAQPEAPQGYNSNPWAAAFHQKYAPLTQFDIGTSQRMPTLQDIAQNADNLAASKRFSMLSPEMVQSVKNDFINQAETKRLQDLQNSYIDSFRNANNPAEMLRLMAMGVGQGALSDKALPSFAQWVIHQTPQYKEVDAGDRIIGSVFRPYEGSITPTTQYNVGVSPNTAATVQGNIDAANIHANATRDVANINAQSDYARAQATIRAQQIAALQDRAKALREEIANDRESLRDMNEKQAIAMQKVIAGKEQELAQINRELLQGYSGMGTQTQGAANTTGNQPNSNNVWFSMVGSPNGISIHPHGSFGYDRGDHKHAGIDIRGVNEGTDIKLTHEMGDTFTVKQAYFSKSFGNNIVVESNRKFNGKTVQFRIAHMQDGSLNLKQGQTIKAGDIVGKVGSTGRSTGPHIHFEVIVDGQQVDPSTFFQNYTADTPAPQQSPQTLSLTSQQTPQQTQNNNVQAFLNEFDPYTYITTTDGNAYSKEQIEELAKRQGLTLEQWLQKNNVQPFPDWELPAFIENVRKQTPRDPVAYMSDNYGNYYTQEEVQREAARNNMSVEDYENQLRAQGFRKAGEVFHDDTPKATVTPADFVHSEHSPQQPFMQPPLASMSTQSSSDNFNSWRSPFGSFDIHQPILRGGISNQPLPTQTVSDDNRNQPLFTGNAANMIRNAVAGLNLTQGKSDAIPMWGIDYRNYAFDPRYPNAERASWPIGAGYDTQQILGWINSHQNYENPFWGHSQPTQSPQKLPLRGNPVTTGANPWSYVNEQNVFPFWNLIFNRR